MDPLGLDGASMRQSSPQTYAFIEPRIPLTHTKAHLSFGFGLSSMMTIRTSVGEADPQVGSSGTVAAAQTLELQMGVSKIGGPRCGCF